MQSNTTENIRSTQQITRMQPHRKHACHATEDAHPTHHRRHTCCATVTRMQHPGNTSAKGSTTRMQRNRKHAFSATEDAHALPTNKIQVYNMHRTENMPTAQLKTHMQCKQKKNHAYNKTKCAHASQRKDAHARQLRLRM